MSAYDDLARDTELAICQNCGNVISRALDDGDPFESWRLVTTDSTYCPNPADRDGFCHPVGEDPDNRYRVVRPAWIPAETLTTLSQEGTVSV